MCSRRLILGKTEFRWVLYQDLSWEIITQDLNAVLPQDCPLNGLNVDLLDSLLVLLRSSRTTCRLGDAA